MPPQGARLSAHRSKEIQSQLSFIGNKQSLRAFLKTINESSISKTGLDFIFITVGGLDPEGIKRIVIILSRKVENKPL